MMKHSEEFKQETVRIALTSGLSRGRVASDLGVGKSTLNKWVSHYRPSDLGSGLTDHSQKSTVATSASAEK